MRALSYLAALLAAAAIGGAGVIAAAAATDASSLVPPPTTVTLPTTVAPPTLTTPTLTTPTLTTPTLTTPTVPTPTLPTTTATTPTTPTPTTPKPSVPRVTAPTPTTTIAPVPAAGTSQPAGGQPTSEERGGSAGQQGGSAGSGAGNRTTTQGAAARVAAGDVKGFRVALAAVSPGRPAVLELVLARRGTVVLTVTQLAPTCRPAGVLEVVGRPGVNRIRFSGVVDGEQLERGTYRLAVGKRQRVVVVTRGRPLSESRLTQLLALNVCAAIDRAPGARTATSAVADTEQASRPRGEDDGGRVAGRRLAGRAPADGEVLTDSGVLAATVPPVLRSAGSTSTGFALMLLLAAPGLVLLTLAAVPRGLLLRSREGHVLVRRQEAFGLWGAAWLATTLLAYVLAMTI